MLTTDRNDPRLGHGTDDQPTTQNAAYLVLSADELAKGFVRPVRDTYRHVGVKPKYPLLDLTDEQKITQEGCGYVKYEKYPEESAIVGRYWTQAQLNSGCGTTTRMALPIAETYARDPKFYGATWCMTCHKHLSVEEFVWEPDGSVLGS